MLFGSDARRRLRATPIRSASIVGSGYIVRELRYFRPVRPKRPAAGMIDSCTHSQPKPQLRRERPKIRPMASLPYRPSDCILLYAMTDTAVADPRHDEKPACPAPVKQRRWRCRTVRAAVWRKIREEVFGYRTCGSAIHISRNFPRVPGSVLHRQS